MTEQPLISVLMTAYNRERYIADAIESVLASNYTNFELIIVDDRSKDETVSIANLYAKKDSRIKVYVNEKNLGDYPNRNKAAGYAKGKYLKYLDADDMLYYFGLDVMARFMELFPEAGFGLSSYPAPDRPSPYVLSPKEIYEESFFGQTNHFFKAPGSIIVKRDVFESLQGFSGRRMIGDMEFIYKISRYHKMVRLPLDLYWNRIHEEQESNTTFARKNYNDLHRQITNEALNHPDCPLGKEQIRDIVAKNRNKRTLQLIKNFILIGKSFK